MNLQVPLTLAGGYLANHFFLSYLSHSRGQLILGFSDPTWKYCFQLSLDKKFAIFMVCVATAAIMVAPGISPAPFHSRCQSSSLLVVISFLLQLYFYFLKILNKVENTILTLLTE